MPQSPKKEINTEPCRVCGVVIRYKADIGRHDQLHRSIDQVTMHKCPFEGCEYQNLQRTNLKTHMRTHTGEKPHGCPDCAYRTADPGSLTRHRKTQHGYVPEPRRAKAETKRHNVYVPYQATAESFPPPNQAASTSSANSPATSASYAPQTHYPSDVPSYPPVPGAFDGGSAYDSFWANFHQQNSVHASHFASGATGDNRNLYPMNAAQYSQRTYPPNNSYHG